jgi:hypothetical protein
LGLNIILLVGACAVAFARPVWGFGILLLLTSTLFHLEQYLLVSLPIGYIEPTEAILVSLLLSVLLKPTVPAATDDHPGAPLNTGTAPDYVLLLIGPYCVWQVLCILLGVLQADADEPTFRFGIRFFLAGVLPWLALYILVRLPAGDSHKIFNITYYLMLATSIVHIVLQVTDYRPAMNAAYFWIPEHSEYDLSWMQQWIDQETFVRGLPQGLFLILLLAVLKIGEYLLSGVRNWRGLAGAVILFTAVFITVTRSLVIVLSAGIIVLVLLVSAAAPINSHLFVRLAGVLVIFAGAALLYNAARPGFLEYWGSRIQLLSGAESKIFSNENRARGLDNLASLAAISDHPLFGLGTDRYPKEYSMRNEPPTDTHPILAIGLVGGVPAILLIMLLQIRLFASCLGSTLHDYVAGPQVAPFVAVLITSAFALNLVGGGGSIYGAPILGLAILTHEMWLRRSAASEAYPMLDRSI